MPRMDTPPYSMNYIKNVLIAVDQTSVQRTNYTSYVNMEQHKCMIYAQMHFNDKFFWFRSEIVLSLKYHMCGNICVAVNQRRNTEKNHINYKRTQKQIGCANECVSHCVCVCSCGEIVSQH